MTGKIAIDLKDVQKTLLLPLWGRAVETRQTTPRLVDETAARIIESIDYDFSTISSNINPLTRYAWIARSIHFDRTIRRFLERHPHGTVVNIGCGLDTTFERTDNGTLRWYDLDLPDVISLRRNFIEESERRTFIACSVLDESWTHHLAADRPVMFLAAGVLYYFEEPEVKKLFNRLAGLFPGCEIIFDSTSPLGVRVANQVVIKAGGMDEGSVLRWGLRRAKDLLSWDVRIKVLEEYPMFRFMRKGLTLKGKLTTLESDLLRIMSIIHLRLGP
ncbi:MAG TPA: class I SAM-dependent methyltransferase [Bacteroidota bacterium]|nr:class I SAM-dependent methyltransferase [Bacteroidota bacterium]